MKKIIILILTACLAVPGQAQEKFTRGFEGKNKIFIPKNSFGGGLSASWRKFSLGEDEGYTVVSKYVGDLKGSYSSVGVAPSFEYFFADNLSAVARFDYSLLGVNLDNASVKISDDLGLSISGQYFKRQSYALAAGVRYYVPFMGSKIFGWFVEGTINGGFVQSMLYEYIEGLKQGTYDANWKLALRVDPGICFFVQENFDFEVSVGLLDLTWNNTRQNENQIKNSSGSSLGTGFNIDLLSIRFGAHFYIW
ncbi:MAG: hypothetical protein IJU68_05880 [Bacteroidales bacterium]|nr:hypothetical protein [Bacteroidales bacterium]